jgi:hypothetical protein
MGWTHCQISRSRTHVLPDALELLVAEFLKARRSVRDAGPTSYDSAERIQGEDRGRGSQIGCRAAGNGTNAMARQAVLTECYGASLLGGCIAVPNICNPPSPARSRLPARAARDECGYHPELYFICNI